MPSLEEILQKLVQADSDQITQGTLELREMVKTNDFIPKLCQVMGTSPQPQIRQYAALMLRKRLARKKNWTLLSTPIKKGILDGIIPILVKEPERLVRNSIAQAIGVMLRHLKNVKDQWPALQQFLQNSIRSNNPAEQEVGSEALANIADLSPMGLEFMLPTLCALFKHVLENSPDLTSMPVFNIITAMKHYVPFLEDHKNCVPTYSQLLPRILTVIMETASVNEERACQELALFEDLLECSGAVLLPNFHTIVTTCLQMAGNETFGRQIRNKSILLTGWLASKKKKTFLKLNLLRPTVETMFAIMSSQSAGEEDEEDLEEAMATSAESSAPYKIASQTVDALGLSLPPDKYMPMLGEYVEPAMQGDDVYKKRAAYYVLAVVVEGCNAYVRANCLEAFVLCIAKGIEDPTPLVRNSALYALGQFSEHLQPDMTRFAPQLLPVLFTYLEQLGASLEQGSPEPPGVDRMFYALETFIENLEGGLQPYLPVLMQRLLQTLDPVRCSPHLRQLAISAIGSTALPAKADILPYFPTIIEALRGYLTQPATSEELVQLQVQSLDTLGQLARGLGAEHFGSFATECVQLGLQLVATSGEEADIRKGAYGVFGAMSTIMGEQMAPLLEQVMSPLLQAIKSEEGIQVHFKEGAEKAFPVLDEVGEVPEEEDLGDEDTEDEDEVCSELEGYSLKNSFTEEKEEALLALKEISSSVGTTFFPYQQTSFDAVFHALSYPHEDVKIAAVSAATHICISWHKNPAAAQALREGLLMLVPKLAELVHCDTAHAVVMGCMELYTELLKELKGLVLQDQGHKEAIVNCVKDVFKGETECQKQEEADHAGAGDDEEDEDDGGDEGEQDEMLYEYSAEVLVPLGHAVGPEDFASIFKSMLSFIVSRTKKQASVAQRSFATGLLAECMSPLGSTQLPRIMNQLLPLLLKLSADKEEEVRNNAIFALGELAKHGKDAVFPHYPQILQALSAALTKKSGPHLLDNVCGALARLIITNVEGVPLDQVLPVFLAQLPLREDMEELTPVFESIQYLYRLGCPQLVNHLDRVIHAAADVLGTDKATKEIQEPIAELLRSIQRDFPPQFASALLPLDQEVRARLLVALVAPVS